MLVVVSVPQKHTHHAKHANSRGSGNAPPPPGNILKFRYQEIEFRDIFGEFSCQ